jgi:hypothetical protein
VGGSADVGHHRIPPLGGGAMADRIANQWGKLNQPQPKAGIGCFRKRPENQPDKRPGIVMSLPGEKIQASGVPTIKVEISDLTQTALAVVADDEHRTPGQQAAYFIDRGLRAHHMAQQLMSVSLPPLESDVSEPVVAAAQIY